MVLYRDTCQYIIFVEYLEQIMKSQFCSVIYIMTEIDKHEK
jgi:hypothetical protein